MTTGLGRALQEEFVDGLHGCEEFGVNFEP